MKYQSKIDEMMKDVLIFDIETSAPGIDIRKQFDQYVQMAAVRWIGFYSYKTNKHYQIPVAGNEDLIRDFIAQHKTLVGFNSEKFDSVVLQNRRLIPNTFFQQIDVMQVIGNNKFEGHKLRCNYMDIDLKPVEVNGRRYGGNSLQGMAHAFKLDTLKGDVDYRLFEKETWTDEEVEQIKTYLQGDVEITRQLFERLVSFWIVFTDWLYEKNVEDWSWIKSSIASLTYKAACKVKGIEPTYGEASEDSEEMGGRAIEPPNEEARGVWYVDEASKYPHTFAEFNLFDEVNTVRFCNDWREVNGEGTDEEILAQACSMKILFHGNEKFRVKGYYRMDQQGALSLDVIDKIKTRLELKRLKKLGQIEENQKSLEYAIKIFLNCFSDDTSVVMADNSIKPISACQVGEYVWSINPKTYMAEKKKISRCFVYDYNGLMHHYKGHYLDFLVTPNHRFLVHPVNNSNIYQPAIFMASQDIAGNHALPIHTYPKNNLKNINLFDFLNPDYFIYRIKSKTRHARVWLNLLNIQRSKKNYNVNDRTFIFTYKEIKNALPIILSDKDFEVSVNKKGRRREHFKPYMYDINAFSYLVGIYLAEGSISHIETRQYKHTLRGNTYGVSIAQYQDVNPEICVKIKNALDVCRLKYSQTRQAFSICGSIMHDFMLLFFGSLKNKCFQDKKFFDILNLEKVFEGLIDGDGSKRSYLFTTKYDCLRDDFIELCMRLGYTFSIKNDGCWRITYNNSRNSFRKEIRQETPYKGKVYCVEIEDNNTLLAGRNNKFNWSGNSLYGAVRSAVFDGIHTPNAGWDCCWIGQQIHEYVQWYFEKHGYEVKGGFTDSWFIKAKDGDTPEKIAAMCEEIMTELRGYMPFPAATHKIAIECFMEYLMFHYDSDEGRYKKNNYCYIKKGKEGLEVEVVGFPIKKSNATKLGQLIYNKYLEPRAKQECCAKFPHNWLVELVDAEMKIEDMVVRYDCKPVGAYAANKNGTPSNNIYAQVSRTYTDGLGGEVLLIKNRKVGRCGGAVTKQGTGKKLGKNDWYYGTVEECVDAGVSILDVDREKIYNELAPFAIGGTLEPKKEKAKASARDAKVAAPNTLDLGSYDSDLIDTSIYGKDKPVEESWKDEIMSYRDE
jgi:hypothetical protein